MPDKNDLKLKRIQLQSALLMVDCSGETGNGADECPTARWKAFPKYQALCKQLGLKDDDVYLAESKLQSNVVLQVEEMLHNKGLEIIGWDEMLEGGVLQSKDVIIMSWRGNERGILIEIEFPSITTPYVKIEMPAPIIPSWHEGKGFIALLFVDEIEVN